MVFELGGNEQNGHTFGWQFGAYQLDGAKAINAQLVADEEPLPDPNWPAPMDPFSIFFGGTDPGRFVPTYMIYSADFRPDVYLITQNALADDTYMSVQRDLYGDEIWIPSKEDSAEAFNIYVDEVQSGKREANGDVQIQNGRVQVTGALGVMEINGILTKMMFDHDRLRHSFYVEESYVIKWMYPYLSPHGLIMKINPEVAAYDPQTAAKDQEFWDWYVRRLLDDPMYRRDFAGQKSFSKLRAALAGLYGAKSRYRESAQAFREACLLYPASPEASFRYAQEYLLPFRKYDVAMELLDFTDSIDPRNQRTKRMRRYITRTREVVAEMERLETKRRDPKQQLTPAETFALGCDYMEVGRTANGAELLSPLIDTLPDARAVRTIADAMLAAGRVGDAERAFNRYLKMQPQGDASAWMELAKLQMRTGRRRMAVASFSRAVSIAGEAAILERLQRDQELMAVYSEWYRSTRPAAQRRGGTLPW